MTTSQFDVIIVGGGIAGSALGGVLARAGLGVLIVEREARFRDRVRGEGTYPFGVADALAMGLGEMLAAARTVDLVTVTDYKDRQVISTYAWADDAIDGLPQIGFSHPRLQETAFAWAAVQGAVTLRPAKAIRYTRNGGPTLTVATGEGEAEYRARLVVGADGRLSLARRWTGGETIADPERHRFGGVLVSGVQSDDRDSDNVAWVNGEAVNWFAAGPDHTRLYVVMTAERLRETGIDRSFAALIDYAAAVMPEGSLANVEQAGPIAFFPNHDMWASRVAGNDVALVGDAAGSPDPTVGLGTALLFHDVRALSEALLGERDWQRATAAYAARRQAYYAAVNAHDRWRNMINVDQGEAADRRREGHQRASERDPTLGGFAYIASRGPDGLIADEAARRMYFGEDLG